MLGIISCHFNPAGFSRPKGNLHRFREQMHGLPLWMIELSFDGSFQLPAGPNVIQLQGNETNALWQKERLLNILADRLPPDITAIAWIDADVSFGNPDWYFETLQALKQYPVVQLFQQAYWLSAKGCVLRDICSVGMLGSYSEMKDRRYPHPGFAWAMRRSVWDQIGGLFDYDIIGSGDAWMCSCWSGYKYACTVGEVPNSLQRKFQEWSNRSAPVIRGNIGCVTGGVFHHFHGSMQNRQYIDRKGIYSLSNYDVDQQLQKNTDGVWQWRDPQSPFAPAVKQYFLDRKEDL